MTRIPPIGQTARPVVLTAAAILLAGAGVVYGFGAVQQGGGRPAPPRDLPPPAASAPAALTGELAGVVVSADSGRPVRRATVRLGRAAGGPQAPPLVGPLVQTTDDEGAFRFKELPAGEYTLTASKPGYLPSTYGQRRPGSGTPGTPISLAANQRLEKLSVPMPRGSVLTGTIVDDAGEAAFGVQVRAMKYVMRNGARVLEQAALDVTDDRGMYRIPALTPGQYVIVATPRDDAGVMVELASAMNFRAIEAVRAGAADGAAYSDQFVVRPAAPGERPVDSGPASGYAPVYYPGSTQASAASAIALGLAEERSGLDLRLELLPLGRIEGTVVAADGRSLAGVEVILEDAAQSLPGIGTRAARLMPDGKFTFAGVVPGQYTIKARTGGRVQMMLNAPGRGPVQVMMTTTDVRADGGRGGGPGDPGRTEESPMWASAEATVVDGTAPVSVTLVLQPALSVSGRIEFAGPNAPPADLARVRVGLTSSASGRPGESAIGQMTSGRDFRIPGVVPGRYRPVVLGLPGWVPKSFELAGRDLLDVPLDVSDADLAGAVLTMVDQMGSLSGTLQDASGRPTAGYTVIVAPEDPRFWTPHSRRIQATRPATDGRFLFRNLPAGSYRLVALEDVEQEAWFDPDFLRQAIAASIGVTIGERDTTVQDVRISR